MRILEAKVDALIRLELAQDRASHDAALAQLVKLAAGKVLVRTVDEEIEDFLSELGVPENIKGYRATVIAIRLAVGEPVLLDALNKGLFARVGEELGDVPSKRVERNIRLAIERAWDNCDTKVLRKYFGNSVSAYSGRPTCGAFLARATREIQRRMGQKEGESC